MQGVACRGAGAETPRGEGPSRLPPSGSCPRQSRRGTSGGSCQLLHLYRLLLEGLVADARRRAPGAHRRPRLPA